MSALPNATPSPETPPGANAASGREGDTYDSLKIEDADSLTTILQDFASDDFGIRISEGKEAVDNPDLAEAPDDTGTAELLSSVDDVEAGAPESFAATDETGTTEASCKTDEPAPAVELFSTRNAPGVVLYVFSGIHLGAELELPEGTYLLGSDDSCDIILQGSFLEARHASLTVESDPSGTPSVRVVALDGSVRDGNEAHEEIRPTPGTPWYVGLTCLTWNRPGVRQAILDPRLEAFAAPASKTQSSPASLDPLAFPVENGTDEAPQPGNKLGNRQTVAANKADSAGLTLSLPKPTRRHAVGRFFPLILLIIFLGGLSVAVRPTFIPQAQYPDILDQKLRKAGLSELSAVPRLHGVEVAGMVEDENQLLQLRNMARGLQFPVYLDQVVVRDDMLQAVHRAFETRGFTVSVSLTDIPPERATPQDGEGAVNGGKTSGADVEKETDRPPSTSQNGKQTLLVQGYVKDRLLEEGLFAALRQDVTNLPPVTRKMVRQDELAAVLEPALAKAGLGFARVDYLPGKVEVKGTFSADNLALLRQIFMDTETALGIPLVSAIRQGDSMPAGPSGTSEAGLAKKKAGPTQELPSRQSPESPSLGGDQPFLPMDALGGLRVTGVTMSPMRFVTTADGQRLFEGSLLPSGYTLDRISTTELTLRKGGQTTTYKLRGAHE